ncbi:Alpha/Beta hydrolase protein [Chytriomyces sp. MP71]|nr:Alpha/Beta hydrolase protein [Chytriomyces sp. MP71]
MRLVNCGYADVALLTSWSCDLCQHPTIRDIRRADAIYSPDGSVFGYIAASHVRQAIVVSFRGSLTALDWLTDLEVIETTYPNECKSAVHSGFLTYWQTIADQVKHLIIDFKSQHPHYTLSFLGHSLGGALALLGAVDLVHSNIIPPHEVHIVTFGQPRVGNAAFGEFVTSLQITTIERVVNFSDDIPHAPPRSWGFRHVPAREFWINGADSGKQLVACNDTLKGGEDSECMNSVLIPGLFPLTAHVRYLEDLEAIPDV